MRGIVISDTTSKLHSSLRATVRSPRLRNAAAVLLIGLAGSFCYARTFDVPLLFDDEGSIAQNASIRSLWPVWPVLFPSVEPHLATVVGRPLLNLSLALNFAWGGLEVTGYHAVNLALHITAGVLLFLVVQRTLRLPRLHAHWGAVAWGIAVASALIWTLHPLQTESVTYIVQRGESLVACFALLTLYCVLRADGVPLESVPGAAGVAGTPPPAGGRVETRGASRRVTAWQAAAVASCALGMASKEVMATVPLIVWLFDRAFLAGSFRAALHRRAPLYAGLAGTWVWLAVLMLSSGGRSSTAGFGFGVRSWDYLLTQCHAITTYLKLCFWPEPLIFDYGAGLVSSLTEVLPQALLVVVLLTAAIGTLIRRPAAGFLTASLFILLAPTSSLVPLVTQTIAEHRMYLPLAPVVVLTVCAVWQMWERLCQRMFSRTFAGRQPSGTLQGLRVGVPVLVLTAVVGTLGWLTWQRNLDYQSALSIWSDTAAKCPANSRAHYNAGVELLNAGQPHRALDAFDRTLALRPRFAEAVSNRGVTLEELGRFDEAVAAYTQAIALRPEFGPYYAHRGNAWSALDRLDEARRDYDRALQLDPQHVGAWNGRGIVQGRQQQHREAIADFTRALELKPGYRTALLNRAMSLYDLGDYASAWRDVTRYRALGGHPPAAFVHDLQSAWPRPEE